MKSTYLAMRSLVLICLVLIVGCAPNQPTPLPQASTPVNVVVTLPSIIESLQQWSGREFTLITPVHIHEQDRILAVNLEKNEDETAMRNALWLAEPLDPNVEAGLKDGTGVVKLRGVLSPSGAYGRNQEFPYQFAAQQATLLIPERSTIANLALNPSALNEVLLRLDGTMLVRPDAALLVDKVSEGGVPKADGQQIKLQRVSLGEDVERSFTQKGDVQWGAVEVVGWWQDGTLTVFSLTPKTPK